MIYCQLVVSRFFMLKEKIGGLPVRLQPEEPMGR